MRSRHLATLVLATCLGLTSMVAMAQDGYRQPLDRIVAVVNEDAIMASDLESRVAQAKARLNTGNVAMPPEQALRSQVLDRMIVEEIEAQRAEKLDLSVDETELNRQVRAVASQNGMTLDQFADAVEADGLTLADVREQIRREMLIMQVQQAEVASRVNITEAEVDGFMQQNPGATRDQARQAIFQSKAWDEIEKWIQEIQGEAFIDNRLNQN